MLYSKDNKDKTIKKKILRDRVLSLIGYSLAVPVSKSHTFSSISSNIIVWYSAWYSCGWYQTGKT